MREDILVDLGRGEWYVFRWWRSEEVVDCMFDGGCDFGV